MQTNTREPPELNLEHLNQDTIQRGVKRKQKGTKRMTTAVRILYQQHVQLCISLQKTPKFMIKIDKWVGYLATQIPPKYVQNHGSNK